MCPKKKFSPPCTPFLTTRHMRVIKTHSLQVLAIFLPILLWFIALYYPLVQLLKLEGNEAFICLSMAFLQTGVLKKFAIFTGKHLCWSLFLKKLPAWWPETLWKRLQHRCFSVNIVTFSRTGSQVYRTPPVAAL